MRKSLLTSAAILGLALSLPAFAQTATDQTPANPSAVKDGTPAAGTGSGAAPGNDPAASGKTGATLGAQAPQGGPGPLGEQSNPAPSSGASNSTPAAGTGSSGVSTAEPGTSGSSATSPGSTGTDQASPGTDQTTTEAPAKPHHRLSSATGTGHWAHQPGTGESGPASAHASNIDTADTHSVIAPHLPSPGVGENAGPERYLRVADRALAAHKTGEAQQALEMAETRLLDRSTAPDSAGSPDQNPRVEAVHAALRSLASKDWQTARSHIQEAMNRGGEGNVANEGGEGGMAAGTTGGGTGTTSSGMSSTGSGTGGVGTTSTMAPNSTNQGVAGGNAGSTPAPMDPSAQGPASAGAAGSPTPGASATAPNQMQPASGAK